METRENMIRFSAKISALVFGVLGLSLALSAAGSEDYRVTTLVWHLGELIASPQVEVEEGQTMSGTFTIDGQHRYTIAVLVNPMTADQVSVSLQFSSGNINIQPNLLVTVGEETSATIDKVRLEMLVERLAEAGAAEQSGE